MAFIFYNANPLQAYNGDCVVRALSLANAQDWQTTYIGLCLQGYHMYDMPSSNRVWAEYLKKRGWLKAALPECCYTVRDFCRDFPQGTYVVGTGTHAIAIKDGSYYDTWDSGSEQIIYYWRQADGIQ